MFGIIITPIFTDNFIMGHLFTAKHSVVNLVATAQVMGIIKSRYIFKFFVRGEPVEP